MSKSRDLDLKNVLLLDNQSTFDMCCNKKFMSHIKNASHPLNMTSNDSGLKINKQCKRQDMNYGFSLAKRQLPTSYAFRIS
jgi:hypothetical protein